LKISAGKFGKPHSQIKAAQQILQNQSTPLEARPEETKKKTVENKLGNVEKLDFSDKKMADMEEKITKTVMENLKDHSTSTTSTPCVFLVVTSYYSVNNSIRLVVL
jgi:hypothetical protein